MMDRSSGFGVSVLLAVVLMLVGCGSSDGGTTDDPSASLVECPNDGSVTVSAVYGNTIEHGSGPWGVRAEDSYVLDTTDGIVYIVPYVEEDIDTMVPHDDRVSLYTCDQSTGAEGAYTRTDGRGGGPNLLDHDVVFFSTWDAVQTYVSNNGLCEPD